MDVICLSMPVITPGTTTREDSVGNIIESIATEESAISHTLNAESEKLQTIINMTNVNAGQLLAANKSAIQLEFALLSKLTMFSDMICQTY